MNYTKKVREYCDANKDSLIDVSKIKDVDFAEIPYKTLLKILNRLEDEGKVMSVSKGVYYIGKNRIEEERILSEYTENGKGMVVGFALFNNLGISTFQDSKIEIYTNAIKFHQKNIGRFLLKFVDLRFDDAIIDLIALLEILNMGYDIIDCNYLVYQTVTELLAQSYSDDNFRQINEAIRYQFATIKMLNDILELKQIKNQCLKIYDN